MHRPGISTYLDVAGVLAHGSLRDIHALYVSPVRSVIDGVVLVNQLATIRKVPPNTVVVLSSELGSGGWQISAALRHAWERRASALIVPHSSYADSVKGLAERLDINLLAADQDPSIVALDLAAEIGAMKSAREVDLASFARVVTKETTVGNVLKTVSHRLGNLRVTLEYDGTVLMSAGTGPQEGSLLSVELPRVESWVQARLVANIPKNGGYDAMVVKTFLEVAAPSILAAWLSSEINDAAASGSSLALEDLSEAVLIDPSATNPGYPSLLARLGWRPEQSYEAVWIRHAPEQPHRPGRTAIVRLLWRKVVPRRPLAEVPGGWLALVPLADSDEPAGLEGRIREKICPSLRELGFSAGISRQQAGTQSLPEIVQEARISAEYAHRLGMDPLAVFAQLGVRAASAFIGDAEIILIAKLALPALMAAPDRAQVVRDSLAYLAHQSSVTLAATSLDLHRNTMQQRLSRARELGLKFDDPVQLLPLHLILHALERTAPAALNPHDSPKA